MSGVEGNSLLGILNQNINHLQRLDDQKAGLIKVDREGKFVPKSKLAVIFSGLGKTGAKAKLLGKSLDRCIKLCSNQDADTKGKLLQCRNMLKSGNFDENIQSMKTLIQAPLKTTKPHSDDYLPTSQLHPRHEEKIGLLINEIKAVSNGAGIAALQTKLEKVCDEIKQDSAFTAEKLDHLNNLKESVGLILSKKRLAIFENERNKIQTDLKETKEHFKREGCVANEDIDDLASKAGRLYTNCLKDKWVTDGDKETILQRVSELKQECLQFKAEANVAKYHDHAQEVCKEGTIESISVGIKDGQRLLKKEHLTEQQKATVKRAISHLEDMAAHVVKKQLERLSVSSESKLTELGESLESINKLQSRFNHQFPHIREDVQNDVLKSFASKKEKIVSLISKNVEAQANKHSVLIWRSAPNFDRSGAKFSEAENRYRTVENNVDALRKLQQFIKSHNMPSLKSVDVRLEENKALLNVLGLEFKIHEMEDRVKDPSSLAQITSNTKEFKNFKKEMRYIINRLHRDKEGIERVKNTLSYLGNKPVEGLSERALKVIQSLDSGKALDDIDIPILLSILMYLTGLSRR